MTPAKNIVFHNIFKASLLLASLACLMGLLLPERAKAEDITPSHVYQATEALLAELRSRGLIDYELYQAQKPDNSPRHPRHVMQKARECHMLVSKILQAEDIEPSPLPEPDFPREVRPADVKDRVVHVLEEARRIRGAENGDIETPPFVSGKLPGDVYSNLKNICVSLHIEIIPSDVYRVAVAVRNNIKEIYNRRSGMGKDMPALQPVRDKAPYNVYHEAWDFLDNLRELALHPDYAIPGGVILPDKEQGDIKPQNVIGLMNDALAETKAIEYALHIKHKTQIPDFVPDKTPSDVFAVIHQANLTVQKLLETEKIHIERIREGSQ